MQSFFIFLNFASVENGLRWCHKYRLFSLEKVAFRLQIGGDSDFCIINEGRMKRDLSIFKLSFSLLEETGYE